MPTPKIKIYWDLETCPVPKSYRSLGEVMKDIRQFTSQFGVVTNIKAYWDKNQTQSAPDPLHSAMPSMGINLVDCSTMQGYTRDALSKMLSVDVVMSAVDGPLNLEVPEDDVIMIVSGDNSVLYPISLLMFRNYTVFLAVPDDDADAQTFQATRVFSWYRDVLSSSISSPPAPIPGAKELRSSGWAVNETRVPPVNPDIPSVTSPSSRVFSPSFVPSGQPTTTVTSPAATPRSKGGSIPPSEPVGTRAPSVLSLNSSPHPSKPLKSFANAIPVYRADAAPALISDGPAAGESQVVDEPAEHVQIDWATSDWAGASGGWDASGGWEMTGQSWISEPALAPKPEAKPTKEQQKKAPTAPETKATTGKKPATLTQNQNSGSTNQGKLSATDTDPPMSVFTPLQQILGEVENHTMRRSQLGEHLAKRRGLYQSAGVGGFGEYINLAAKKGIIVCMSSGTDSNQQQVKLRRRR